MGDAGTTGWWPLFDLRVRTPRVELRPFGDDDIDEYCALIGGGIHDPERMPFCVPWTDAEPPELQRGAIQFHWRCRGEWTPQNWRLPFLVIVDGCIVGQQDAIGEDFAIRRVVESGSWLGLAHQGKGIGTEMRSALLHFAFAGLGAGGAITGAFADNPSSQGVTAKLGYEPNGERVGTRRGQPATVKQYTLSRERWEANRRDDIVIEGLDAARVLFGA